TFWTGSDDGSALYIDNARAVNNDGLHGYSEASGTLSLTEGSHRFEVRAFNNAGPGSIIAYWAGPDFAKQIIPAEAFSPWTVLRWADSRSSSLSTTNLALLHAVLELQRRTAGTSQVQIVAFDADTLSSTQLVTLVCLADMDKDGIPDRDDPDIDGDGLS